MLVVLEGSDGSGKSTQARQLAEELEKEFVAVQVFKFPSGRLRSAILENAESWRVAETRTAFFVDFALWYDEIVETSRNGVAILDRSWVSTAAYQAQSKWLQTRRDAHVGLEGAMILPPSRDAEQLAFQQATKAYMTETVALAYSLFPAFYEDIIYLFLDVDPETGGNREEDKNFFSGFGETTSLYRRLFTAPEFAEAREWLGGRVFKFNTGAVDAASGMQTYHGNPDGLTTALLELVFPPMQSWKYRSFSTAGIMVDGTVEARTRAGARATVFADAAIAKVLDVSPVE